MHDPSFVSTNASPSEALAACRRAFAQVGLFSFGINVLMLVVPLYMLQVYDRVLSSESEETLLFLSLLAVGALLVMGLLDVIRARILARVGEWLERRLGPEAFARSIAATLQARPYRTESLRDLQQMRAFLGGAGIIALFDAPWAPLYLGVVYLLHPVLGHLMLGGAVLLFGCALMNELLTRQPLREANQLGMQSLQDAERGMRAAEAIDAMGMTPTVTARWQAGSAGALAYQLVASDRANAIMAAAKFLRLSLQVAMLGVGALLVLERELTAGAMVAGSILTARGLAPVEQALGAWRQWVATRVAFARLSKMFREVKAGTKAMALPAPTGHLTVEGINFVYPDSNQFALRNVSFELRPGEALAIVGPSAAGKSTLVRILLGLRSAHGGGKVRLDGADVATWDRAQFGRHVGYLPQDVELFAGTVAENVARLTDAAPEAVIEAAMRAGVHETILRLPAGYETPILEGGANLSAGQRQRIGLARALFGRPRLVVLDEPNSNLDGEGEQALIRAISVTKQDGASVIIVAHRPSVLGNVDKVMVLRNGRIESLGPRHEIMKQLTKPHTVATEPVSAPMQPATQEQAS